MLSSADLHIDAARVALELERTIRSQVRGTLRRRGVVVGISGGVDSSVVAALCSRALGKERVFGLLMPERDSASISRELGARLVAHLGIDSALEEIGSTLAAAGCYRRQAEAIRGVFPDYGDGWKCKLTLPPLLDGDRLSVFHLTVESAEGERRSARMPAPCYRKLVAATSFKQRVRKMVEYYHADRLGYAVAGTPNRLEYDQGFFVKAGDGAADIKPIAHLYKTQVYDLAEHLGVPAEIRRRPPTTDTFSLAQTQEEFYFALPYQLMDLCLYGRNRGLAAAEVAVAVGLTAEQVERVYRDIDAKRRATRYLHRPPLLMEPVAEVDETAERKATAAATRAGA